MDKMKLGNFTFQFNPEQFRVDAVAEPLYREESDGSVTYLGLGPLCRVIRGRGVFQGPDAVKYFNALSVIMATRRQEQLVHPIWGTYRVFLTELFMEQDSRENFISYRFAFREANENGMIPRLPQNTR